MDLFERAEAWIRDDSDHDSREELAALAERARGGDEDARRDLADRFAGPLVFGTAGLRGVIGAGETRMNLAVVRRTTFGLATHLLNDAGAEAAKRGIVIGYDGRRMSRAFAEETARVLAARGIVSHLSTTVCPTPVCAFAVGRLGAAAGVMVTASHNPPEYNGYKAYWGNGAQIIPPHDTGIAAAIDAAPAAKDVPSMPLEEAREAGLVRDVPADLEESYLAGVQALALGKPGDRGAPIVYTAMHGVGDRLAREALRRAGFASVTSVPEQAEPDGAFPTVAFPNPEEKGALDLAQALAAKLGADLIIASDPDVDRLAVAVRPKGGDRLVQLTGNQVGVLLGHYLLTEGPAKEKPLVVTSCVSSPQLGAIAEALGARCEETLTGFKWITNRAMELEAAQGYAFVFGYEEALGYTVGTLVRDKDGISAALLFAELFAARRAEGKTIFDELERIARAYGYFASGQLSVTMKGADGLAKIRAVMDGLRKERLDRIGPLAVVATSDVKTGRRTARDGSVTELALPPSDVLIFGLEGGSRLIARPSGTEPKLKIYFDVREPMADGEPLAGAEARANRTMDLLREAFTKIAGL